MAIEFRSSGAGSINRPLSKKLEDSTNAADFGALFGAAVDNTAAINLATRATDPASEDLWYGINLPNGVGVIGTSDNSVFVRKGQTLSGTGFGSTTLDLFASGANTVPGVVLGRRSDGSVDDGGQAVSLQGLTLRGGPAAKGAVQTGGVAGWKIADVFFTAPGIGVAAGGGDGLLHDCLFDLGLNHVVTGDCGNVLVSNSIFYLGNYQFTVGSNTRDLTITGCQFE